MPSTTRNTFHVVSLLICTIFLSEYLNGQSKNDAHSFDSVSTQTSPLILDREVRADMAFLADDDLHGRGSATRDEHIAALFAASQFQALGLEPGAPNNSFIQKSPLPDPLPENYKRHISRSEDTL